MVRDVEANGLDATSERPPDFRGMPVDRSRAFDAKAGWRFPLYLGGKAIGAKDGVSGIPQSVIAAKDGSVIAKHVGFCSESEWKELLLKDIGAAIE